MKKFRTLIAVCIVAVVTLCCGVVLTACGAPDPTVSVSGYVVDANGAAVAGATVKAGDKTATANEEGLYTFTGLPYADLTIKASKEGYFDGEAALPMTEMELTEENKKQNVYTATKEVAITQHAVISGIVKDAAGTPVEGASIKAGETTVTTGADGKYTLGGLVRERTSLVVSKAGYYNNTQSVTFTGKNYTAKKDVTLAKIGKVVVKVVEADGTTAFGKSAVVKLGESLEKTTIAGANEVVFGEADKVEVEDGTVTVAAEGFVTFTQEITAAGFDNTATPPTYTVTAKMEKEFLPGIGMNEFMETAEAKAITGNYYRMQFFNGTGDEAQVVGFDENTDIRNKWAISKSGGTATHQEGIELAGTVSGEEKSSFLYTYLYGKVDITAANSELTVSGRRYDSGSAAEVGAYIFVYNEDGTLAEKVALSPQGASAAINTYYTYVSYDLSAYIGKSAVIAVGNVKGVFNLNMITLTDKTEAFLTKVDGVKLSTLKAQAPALTANDYAQTNKSADGIVGKWATMGRVENLNEGASCTFAESDTLTGPTKIHDFLYGKKDISGIASVTFKSRTFTDQVTSHGSVSPVMNVVLIAPDGTETMLTAQTVATDTETDYTFNFPAGLSGEYIIVIGSMNGYHAPINNIVFNAAA